ncbi:MAG: hypothetical protein SFY32_04415 [Bacteroidota bacterium]|nr:hypothetical protein [Bacteroidota bacterium]
MSQPTTLVLSDEVVAQIDARLFGHFIEKCSWADEIGGDLLIDSTTHKPIPKAVELIKEMNIPMLRYPGGTDWDYHNWLELIDNVPGKHVKRPAYYTRDNKTKVSDHRLGLNEFLSFCEDQNIEPILVLNVGDPYFNKISIDSSVKHALALYEYVNGNPQQLNSKLNYNWAALRQFNGRAKPFNVMYFEIGNEPWGFSKEMTIDKANKDSLLHYINCIKSIAKALKSRDSNLKILLDVTFKDLKDSKSQFGNYADFLVFHSYAPWDICYYNNSGTIIKNHKMKAEEIWKAWVTTPLIDPETGMTSYKNEWIVQMLEQSGLPIAVTEWNWNGWHQDKAAYNGNVAKGVGAAGYLHAFMRKGNIFKIANQSMLIGKHWGINSIRVDQKKPYNIYMFPSGMVTALYSKYHGDFLTNSEVKNNIYYSQPFEAHSIKPSPKVALFDIITTQSKNKIFIHVLSRSFKETIPLNIDASKIKFNGKGVMHELVPIDNDELVKKVDTNILYSNAKSFTIKIKPRTVNIIELETND